MIVQFVYVLDIKVGVLLCVLNRYIYVPYNVGNFSRLVDGWEVSEIPTDIFIMLLYSSTEVGGVCVCVCIFFIDNQPRKSYLL
jgi:hypothetical protein